MSSMYDESKQYLGCFAGGEIIGISGFSLSRLHMGGRSAGGQSVNGRGTREGGHRPYGGRPIFDRLYHKLKILLLLSYNYTMQFVGYDSIKTR